jgi:hypothetical protein
MTSTLNLLNGTPSDTLGIISPRPLVALRPFGALG